LCGAEGARWKLESLRQKDGDRTESWRGPRVGAPKGMALPTGVPYLSGKRDRGRNILLSFLLGDNSGGFVLLDAVRAGGYLGSRCGLPLSTVCGFAGWRQVKKRLDLLLVERGLTPSREQARALIMAGSVAIGGQPADKPGTMVDETSDLSVQAPSRYVSRGGLKLERALEEFHLDVTGRVAVDVGASTGGFTDCLLQHGASRVYAVDVGYGQLDWRLRTDPRVVVMERTNIRYLTALAENAELATTDVSFISLRLVLPAISRLLRDEGWIVALVKPQFEAGRGKVGKGGVVRDPEIHREVLSGLAGWGDVQGYGIQRLTVSPVRGPAGNVEFLALVVPGHTNQPHMDEEIEAALGQAAALTRGPGPHEA
jgi:23S rRNA (cytidine1920-2'-O)/16S rRNA (cytidine1409-2'-O)-methyltransferase